ncbi:MAG: hypothetical protein KGI27_11600 [Thaumarchaeota archaeon]|nr:hypothetical protein [Nitrososphaerota archaeon]
MDSVTETCIVPESKDKVFQFLSDIENLPKWSTQFVKELVVVQGKQKAITPIGEVFLRYESDQKSGLIDIYAGVEEQQMTPAYLRVIPFSANSTGVMFTFFKWDNTDDMTWKIFCKWIKIEVGNIKKRFS